MEDELQTLVDQSKSAREVVRREVSRVKGKQEEVQQREQQLNATLQALRMATTRHEAYEIIEDAAHLAEEDSQRTKDFLGMFPDVHAVTTVAKVAEASRAALQAAAAASASIQAALEAAGTTAAAVGDSSLPATLAEASSIADRLQVLLTPPLTTEDLFSLRQPAKGMVEAGLVFAVHEVEGRSRYARISLEDGRLHLHSLQAQAPPSCAVTLQMVEVVPAGPPCEVFMDLEWPGSAARRVVVSLPQYTPLGLQFVLLCSGQRGACYANSRLFEVWDQGRPGEYVVGGDYQTASEDREGGDMKESGGV